MKSKYLPAEPIALQYSLFSLIALLPFRKPTMLAAPYLGGIVRHIWTWSGHACPFINSTPFWPPAIDLGREPEDLM